MFNLFSFHSFSKGTLILGKGIKKMSNQVIIFGLKLLEGREKTRKCPVLLKKVFQFKWKVFLCWTLSYYPMKILISSDKFQLNADYGKLL